MGTRRWALGAGWAMGLVLVGCGEMDAVHNVDGLCDPKARGLVITELMPDPAGTDAGREWVELANFGSRAIALDRMVLSIGDWVRQRQHSLTGLGTLLPGQLIVLGDGTPQSAPIDASYGPGLEMPNDAGVVALHCRGAPVAAVVYGADMAGAEAVCQTLAASSDAPAAEGHSPPPGQSLAPRCDVAPAPVAGASLSLDVADASMGASPSVARVWYRSRGAQYDDYNIGTPKAANLGAAVCQTEWGDWRRIKSPKAGEVRVLAVYADPPGPDDGEEWLVLYVAADAVVDLAGLHIVAQVAGHKPRQWSLEDTICHPTAPHQIVTVRILTFKTCKAACARATDDAALVLWGQTLPNQAMRLVVGFHHGLAVAPQDAWCDSVDVPKARCGNTWVRTDVPGLPSFVARWPELHAACGEQ